MNLLELPQAYKRVDRLNDIIGAFSRYGIQSTGRKLNPARLVSWLAGRVSKIPDKRLRAKLIRGVIEDLGATYIKFGQWLSVRPDFVPPEILKELEQLQDNLPPVPFKIIQRTVKKELGKPIEEVFLEFDSQPLSTASIAQVHRAVLKSGEMVAVKVQHPKLKELIEVDIGILQTLAAWAIKTWPHLKLHRPDEAITNFKNTLMNEVDFMAEAKSQERMGQIFEDTDWFHVPKVYWDHTTQGLLVMEFMDGLKLSQRSQFEAWDLDPQQLAGRLSDCMFNQIFEHGFFHSDPHPGNILYMRENHIGLLDFGIVAKYSDKMVGRFLDWFYAVVYRDLDLFEQTFLAVAKPLVPIDENQFRTDCLDYLDEMHFQPAHRISFAKVFDITNQIIYRNKLSTPATFLFFFKAISTLEGVTRRLDPKFDWREVWGPKMRVIIRRRYSPTAIIKKYWKVLKDYDQLIVEFPTDFRNLVDTIVDGRIGAEVYLPQLDEVMEVLGKLFRKLSTAVVLGAIIFGLFYLGRGKDLGFITYFWEQLGEHWPLVILGFLLLFFYLGKK